MDDVELEWFRCPDGYRVAAPSDEEMLAWQGGDGDDMIITGDMIPVVKYVPLTTRRLDYNVMRTVLRDVRGARRSKPTDFLERFVNTSTDLSGITEFVSEFGPLIKRGPDPIVDAEEINDDWIGAQRTVRHVLLLAADGQHDELRRVFKDNRLGRCSVRLFNSPAGQQSFHRFFQPDSLLGLFWVLAAQAVCEPLKVIRCAGPGCTNILINGKGAGHHGRTTCSNKCRSALHDSLAKHSESTSETVE